MSYEEFINLQKGDTVEDPDGVLGSVDHVRVSDEEVWVNWMDKSFGCPLWSNYKDINKY